MGRCYGLAGAVVGKAQKKICQRVVVVNGVGSAFGADVPRSDG
jgi:hypothetical protein